MDLGCRENHPAMWSPSEIRFKFWILGEDDQLGTQLSKAWPMDHLTTGTSPTQSDPESNTSFFFFLELRWFDTWIQCANAQVDFSYKCFETIKPQCVKDLKM